MARLRSYTADLQIAVLDAASNADGQPSGAATYDATVQRTGASCWAFAGSATAAFRFFQWTAPVAGTTIVARVYFRKTGNPASASRILALSPSVLDVQVYLETNGTLTLRQATVQIGSASAVVADNTWFKVELSATMNTGATDAADARLEGVSFASTSGQSWSDSPLNQMHIGWATAPGAAGPTLYADDAAVNDSTGADENSWPGGGKVYLLAPTAQSAAGSGWQKPGGATTLLNTSIDNTPPNGVADSTAVGQAENQVRNATAAANSDLDMTMTTYTAAGVGASDTVRVVQQILNTAAPVSTAAKTGQIQIVSNPATSLEGLDSVGATNAFWAGIAAGTFATGWHWTFGTSVYNPAVTLGTAPVARVRQITSSTRIAMVDAMFIVADVEPGATATPPLPVVVDFAVSRAANY